MLNSHLLCCLTLNLNRNVFLLSRVCLGFVVLFCFFNQAVGFFVFCFFFKEGFQYFSQLLRVMEFGSLFLLFIKVQFKKCYSQLNENIYRSKATPFIISLFLPIIGTVRGEFFVIGRDN
jgi:hypothetical protein